MRSLISVADLTKKDIENLLSLSAQLKVLPAPPILRGKILASCFFEPSTRTRLSFEAAMLRLGGQVLGFSDAASTSTAKGESLYDSMKIIGSYSDLIVLRHPLEGAARYAAEATDKPIVNAGDGSNQHPSQTLLDLFTIQECQGRLDNLKIAVVGDLKYGRTAHSLALACAHFDIRLYFISPDSLTMPDTILSELKRQGVKFSFHRALDEVIEKIDILYMTRLQKERFAKDEFEKIQGHFSLKKETLKGAKDTLKILHPLPRVLEIPREIDDTPHAHYFTQAENGLYVRQALLLNLLAPDFNPSHAEWPFVLEKKLQTTHSPVDA